jgi:hypothetical protein
MNIKLTIAALTAAMVLVGCAAPMATPDIKSSLSGEAFNPKLGQDTPVTVQTGEGYAVVHFTDLKENGQPCQARFQSVDSKVAGTASYSGDFAGSIGACRIFSQDPGVARYLLLTPVDGGANLTISHDPLGREAIIRGTLN